MIIFEKLRYKNFLSTGNIFTEINFTEHKMNLISGKNGGGKSTILDALVYALYGKPFRKIVKGLLMNSINKKEMLVELELSIGSKKYLIKRGDKPKIFEVYENEVLMDQDAANKDYQTMIETDILKCNYKTFTQIVILGSATYIPFMELVPADRRKIIEDILDIGVFSEMAVPLKEDIDDTKEDIAEIKRQVSILETKINMGEEQNRKIQNNKTVDLSGYEEDINNIEKEIVKLNSKKIQIENNIKSMGASEIDLAETKAKLRKHQEFKSDINSNKKLLMNELKFFKENDNCPVCKQHITEEFKNTTCESHNKEIEEIDVGIGKLNKLITKFENIIEEEVQNENILYKQTMLLSNVENEINNQNRSLSMLKKAMSDVENRQKESLDLIDVMGYKDELKVLMDSHNERFFEMEVLSEISKMLKDGGIKNDIISKYIPKMNELINDYLSKFDLYVNFVLDENFDETIKSRYRDNFSYMSFSQGEKLRINLSIMLTWKEIAKKKNSISTNLLILDETLDGALDGDGVSDFVKALRAIDGGNNNIFVISHREEGLKDLFDNHLHFEKQKNFSIMTTKE